jgi:Cu(I)/Ag(I) efflux system membrane protein CusA/SilA
VDGIQELASQIQNALSGLPEMRSIFAEKIAQGFYVNVEVNRPEAARYGLTVRDIQTAVASGIGGENIAENIEGRERYPINVRYQRDFRDNVDRMRRVLIATPSGRFRSVSWRVSPLAVVRR